jgi:hypothetical protein
MAVMMGSKLLTMSYEMRTNLAEHTLQGVTNKASWPAMSLEKINEEFTDSALTIEDRVRKYGGTEYRFVMGKSSSLSVVGTYLFIVLASIRELRLGMPATILSQSFMRSDHLALTSLVMGT